MKDRVHLWLRGRTWWVHYITDDGRRIRRSLQTNSRKKAQQERARLEYELRFGQRDDPEPVSMELFLEEYLEWQRARKTKSGFQRDHSYLRRFLEDTPVRLLTDLAPAHVSHYLTRRRSQDGLAPRSLNRIREVLHTMCSYGVDHGYLSVNPVSRIKRFPVPDHEIVFLRRKEIDELLRALEGDPLQPVVATLIFSGLRRGEACWLAWDDVDLTGRLLHVRGKTIDGATWQPKTKRARRIPISSSLLPFLENHRNGTRWVHPSPKGCRYDADNLTRDFTLKRQALDVPWRLCDFRHTFGSHLAQKGVSLYKISILMGNSPEICRRHYARLVPEDMREEVEF